MIRADEFTDKNGTKIELEDNVLFNGLQCIVCGINLYSDSLYILRKNSDTPMWVNRSFVEVTSIP